MAGETIITVVGNLTDDPELKFTPSGAAVANFTIASTPRTFDRQANEWRDGDALFLRCSAWRQLAENIAGSLQKGQRVIAQGALRVRTFERQDGSKGTSVEMTVEEVGPSLRFATASVQKASRGQTGAPSGGGNPWAQQQSQQGSPAWGGPGQAQGWAAEDEPPF